LLASKKDHRTANGLVDSLDQPRPPIASAKLIATKSGCH
jgi:hypothetical protein